MVENNVFGKSLIGIFVGNFIACLILIIFREDTYVRFWNYMGIFIFTIINFIVFLLPLGIYTIISKIFKIKLIYEKIFVFCFLFSLFYTLGTFYFILPLINKFGGNIKSPFISFFINSGIPYFFFPLLLFSFILFSYKFLRIKEK